MNIDAVRSASPHRMVIVGGGAGGLELATRLGDTLGRRRKAGGFTMPTSTPDPTQWLADLMAAQQTFIKSFGSNLAPADPANPFQLWQQAVQQMTWVWTAAIPGLSTAIDAPAPDRRFAADPWCKDPRFDALAKAYLGQAEQLRKALAAAPLDARSKGQWSFLLRQVVDAASPANCLATNPEAMQMAVDSGGASLMEGMRLFMQDMAKGRISMTDDTAFEIGRNVAASPGRVVFENELIQLIQYAPTTAKVHKRPLVIVPPCINKFYILDLQPDNSFVGHAVAQGHTVFLVSWRNAGPGQAHLSWDDYLELGVMQAVVVALAISRADRVNALGFCVGGTLLTSALAVMSARGIDKVACLTLLTTLLDFSDTGELGLMVDEASVAQREQALAKGGLLKGRELAQVFAALRANDLIWPYVVNGYLKGQAPPAFDLLFWNGDDTNLPGPMYCWYLRNTYLENKLREPGATIQCGEPVDLSLVELPTFLYASREDHIVPWQTAYKSTELLGGHLTFVLGASGHIAGVINPPAKNKRNHWVGELTPEANDWLAAARSEPGSWWPAWASWLKPHAGTMVPAPRSAGNAEHRATEPAPGRYVKAKAP